MALVTRMVLALGFLFYIPTFAASPQLINPIPSLSSQDPISKGTALVLIQRIRQTGELRFVTDGETLEFTVERQIQSRGSSSFSLRSKDGVRATLLSSFKILELSMNDQIFRYGLQEGTIVVEEETPIERPFENDVVDDGSGGGDPRPQASNEPPAEPHILDVLIVYTKAAKQKAGGKEALKAKTTTEMETANLALAQSRVDAVLNIVGFVQVDNKLENHSNHDGATMLKKLQYKNDGVADKIHKKRNEKGADLILTLVSKLKSKGSMPCGIAKVAKSYSNLANSAGTIPFSIVSASNKCLKGHTIAHEIGHNLGLVHDIHHSSFPGMFSDSYGKNHAIDSCKNGCPKPTYWINTIMSYWHAFETKILFFSNSNVGAKYDIVQPGVANKSDAAATLKLSIPIVAEFRPHKKNEEKPTAPSFLMTSSDLTHAIRLTWNETEEEIDHYRIYRSAMSGKSCDPTHVIGLSWTNEFVDTHPQAKNASLYYSVRAVRKGESSACSTEALGTTGNYDQAFQNLEVVSAPDLPPEFGAVFLWPATETFGHIGVQLYRTTEFEEAIPCDPKDLVKEVDLSQNNLEFYPSEFTKFSGIAPLHSGINRYSANKIMPNGEPTACTDFFNIVGL